MENSCKRQSDYEWFDASFPGLVDDIVKENEDDEETRDAAKRVRKVSSIYYRCFADVSPKPLSGLSA